jgi:hypothetical protein
MHKQSSHYIHYCARFDHQLQKGKQKLTTRMAIPIIMHPFIPVRGMMSIGTIVGPNTMRTNEYTLKTAPFSALLNPRADAYGYIVR